MRHEFKPIFFTSDWHIGHGNVIKYSSRPFTDIDHMDKVLINNYNNTVSKDGICYFLGDMGMDVTENRIKTVMDQLNGTKVLILGNHDKGMQAMLRKGFDAVLFGAQFVIANEIVTATHCPLLGVRREYTGDFKIKDENWHGEGRSRSFSTFDYGQFHLHGHIHSPNGGRSTKILGRQYDVGVDANKYTPVSQSTIESFISLSKKQGG